MNRATLANDDVVDILNDLLANARDGADGFAACAEQIVGAETKQVFVSAAAACARAADELTDLIRNRGGIPVEGGTATGALHRGWIQLKAAVGADSELSILEACERGEDTSVARYRKALDQNLPEDVRAAVQQQADGAQRNHADIKELRDLARKLDDDQ